MQVLGSNMIGAFAGDIIGSVYEANPVKTTDFPLFTGHSRFTDDTVLTTATADALLNGLDYATVYRRYGRAYPRAGYGGAFLAWLKVDDAPPYNSWGNGSAMRISPVGLACDSTEDLLEEAEKSAAVTHNHPEGIKGAQAVALAIFMGRKGKTKHDIRRVISEKFDYNLSRTIEEIRPGYFFDISCQGSVPQAITAFLQSDDVESAIRLAVSLGGDCDTQACMAGAIAHAFYKELPYQIEKEVRNRLPQEFVTILDAFSRKYVG
jgi:ADP-ribosyl-[dinitrogen reductase] hydrolase